MIPLLYQLSYSATAPPSGQYVYRGRRVKPAFAGNAGRPNFFDSTPDSLLTRQGETGMVGTESRRVGAAMAAPPRGREDRSES